MHRNLGCRELKINTRVALQGTQVAIFGTLFKLCLQHKAENALRTNILHDKKSTKVVNCG